MPPQNRNHDKGRKFEQEVLQLFREIIPGAKRNHFEAEDLSAGAYSIECKIGGIRPWQAMREAKRRAPPGKVPIVCARFQNPGHRPETLVIMRLDDWLLERTLVKVEVSGVAPVPPPP